MVRDPSDRLLLFCVLAARKNVLGFISLLVGRKKEQKETTTLTVISIVSQGQEAEAGTQPALSSQARTLARYGWMRDGRKDTGEGLKGSGMRGIARLAGSAGSTSARQT